jgi:hypothetical protein
MNVKEKLQKAIADKLDPKQFLKLLTPLNLEFKLKFLANVTEKNPQKTKHDYAALLQFGGEDAEGLVDNPEDLEALISQLLGERQSKLAIKVQRAKYEQQEWLCVFIDLPKEDVKN